MEADNSILNILLKLDKLLNIEPFSQYSSPIIKRTVQYQLSKLQDDNNCVRILVCGHSTSGRSSFIARLREYHNSETDKCMMPVCKRHGTVAAAKYMDAKSIDEYDKKVSLFASFCLRIKKQL